MRYLLLILVFFISCNNSNDVIVVTEFENVGELVADIHKLPNPILLPRLMLVSDSLLFVYKEKEEKLFLVFNLPELHYLGEYGNRGQGPNEFVLLDPRSFCYSEKGFKVLEAGSNIQKTVRYEDGNLSVVQHERVFNEMKPNNNGFYSLEDSVYLVFGNIGDLNEYCLFDMKTQEMTHRDNYPNWIANNEIDPSELIFRYMKYCVVHPDKNKFASFYTLFKRARFYDKNVNLLHDIDVKIEPYGINFDRDVRLRPVYYTGQPFANKEYIYVLCNNMQNGYDFDNKCELQIWNWEGKGVGKYRFDRKISYMAVSDNYDKIYALDSLHPDELYIYDLPINLK